MEKGRGLAQGDPGDGGLFAGWGGTVPGCWQRKTAFLPDYGFKPAAAEEAAPAGQSTPDPEPWPAVNTGTSVAGIVGGLLTLALACLVGQVLNGRARIRRNGWRVRGRESQGPIDT